MTDFDSYEPQLHSVRTTDPHEPYINIRLCYTADRSAKRRLGDIGIDTSPPHQRLRGITSGFALHV